MQKVFISANELLEDSFRLGKLILESGFRPDIIVGVWRGGAPVGIAVQEYLEHRGIKTDHIAIRTSSYYGIDQQNKLVNVHGMHYLVENADAEDKLLIVDDVFDSGRSIVAIIDDLKSKTRRNTPSAIRVATPWYKPNRNTTDVTPDYFLHETDAWLVFPHELQGMSADELAEGKQFLAPDVLEDLTRE